MQTTLIRSGIALLLLSCQSPATDAGEGSGRTAGPERPPQACAPVDPAARGVWQSRGYGWLAQLGASEFSVYDHCPAGTMRVSADLEAMLAVEFGFRRDGETLVAESHTDGSTRYLFDRVERLPDTLSTPPASDPMSVFDYAWGVMNSHYAFFELHGVDWDARRRALRPRVRTDMTESELFDLLTEMLKGLADDHLSLEAEIDGAELSYEGGGPTRRLDPALDAAFAAQSEEKDRDKFAAKWRAIYRNNVAMTVLDGKYQVEADGRLIWGLIGDVGYINIPGMGGFSKTDDIVEELKAVNAAINSALAGLAECKAVIVDVTFNTGGYDEVHMAIASHFAETRTLAFTKFPSDTKKGVPQAFHVIPAKGVRFLGPVALVTSDFTVSAAEGFTFAMRSLPNVTHYGNRTRGALSDILSKRLPNGWSLGLSNETYLDPDGTHWETKGIPPQKTVNVFVKGDIETSHASAILTVAKMLK